MSFYDGYVIAVPTARKDAYIAHARTGDPVFVEQGATRVVECWGEDVKHGHTTNFHRAVEATEDETVVFGWIEWPDKATRDAAWSKMMSPDFKDPRMDPETNPMPFDGKRMIYGGFEPLLEAGDPSALPYVQGFMVPVPNAKRADYTHVANEAWDKMFKPYGALCVLEAWGSDLSHGKQTDFFRSVQATEDENVVFSFMAWPSREACDAAGEKMQNDPEMQMPDMEMPFDGKRMVYGGFAPILDLPAAKGA